MPPRAAPAPASDRVTGDVVLGRTLPSLLDEAIRDNPNEEAFRHKRGGRWRTLSTRGLKERADRMAAGLLERGLEPGDRVAFYVRSDLSFLVPDMACLRVGLVDVPIYLTHGAAAVRHILRETRARALVATDLALLEEVLPQAREAGITLLLVEDASGPLPALRPGEDLLSFEAIEAEGERALAERPDRVEAPAARVDASDLATVIYTSGTTGLPKGVMLTHQNLSSNAIASFTGLTGFRRGPQEAALSFLPLTHVFARAIQYGYTLYGTSVSYCTPDEVGDMLREVRPTVFASVPRVLERAYERILARGEELRGVKRRLFDWALGLARRFEVERPPTGAEAAKLALADRLVLSKWREALGGRVRSIIVGGAALRPELANLFGAAGIEVLQGYGLTETSPVIAYNRPGANRPGTVGPALAGVEIRIADDGEILTRGPHVMRGYYERPEATAEAIDADGWFATGDLGELDADGYLRITGRRKNLFKLSTGKYVMPQPLEGEIEADPLIEHALVIGDGRKHCAALLFASPEALRSLARRTGGADDPAAALRSDAARERVTDLLRAANADMPPWSQVKKAALVLGEISTDNDLLTPTLKLKRPKVLEAWAAVVEGLYGDGVPAGADAVEIRP